MAWTAFDFHLPLRDFLDSECWTSSKFGGFEAHGGWDSCAVDLGGLPSFLGSLFSNYWFAGILDGAIYSFLRMMGSECSLYGELENSLMICFEVSFH